MGIKLCHVPPVLHFALACGILFVSPCAEREIKTSCSDKAVELPSHFRAERSTGPRRITWTNPLKEGRDSLIAQRGFAGSFIYAAAYADRAVLDTYGTLTIKSPKTSDSGFYKCEVTTFDDKGNVVACSFRLTVEMCPEVTTEQRDPTDTTTTSTHNRRNISPLTRGLLVALAVFFSGWGIVFVVFMITGNLFPSLAEAAEHRMAGWIEVCRRRFREVPQNEPDQQKRQ